MSTMLIKNVKHEIIVKEEVSDQAVELVEPIFIPTNENHVSQVNF